MVNEDIIGKNNCGNYGKGSLVSIIRNRNITGQ